MVTNAANLANAQANIAGATNARAANAQANAQANSAEANARASVNRPGNGIRPPINIVPAVSPEARGGTGLDPGRRNAKSNAPINETNKLAKLNDRLNVLKSNNSGNALTARTLKGLVESHEAQSKLFSVLIEHISGLLQKQSVNRSLR